MKGNNIESSIKCWVCDRVFKIEDYGEGVCPNCGQEYVYDEGYRINLTTNQFRLLKNNIKELRKKLKQKET